jgi:hypothetical protein
MVSGSVTRMRNLAPRKKWGRTLSQNSVENSQVQSGSIHRTRETSGAGREAVVEGGRSHCPFGRHKTGSVKPAVLIHA